MTNVFNALKDGTLTKIIFVLQLVTYATPGMKKGSVKLVIEDTSFKKDNVLGTPMNSF